MAIQPSSTGTSLSVPTAQVPTASLPPSAPSVSIAEASNGPHLLSELRKAIQTLVERAKLGSERFAAVFNEETAPADLVPCVEEIPVVLAEEVIEDTKIAPVSDSALSSPETESPNAPVANTEAKSKQSNKPLHLAPSQFELVSNVLDAGERVVAHFGGNTEPYTQLKLRIGHQYQDQFKKFTSTLKTLLPSAEKYAKAPQTFLVKHAVLPATIKTTAKGGQATALPLAPSAKPDTKAKSASSVSPHETWVKTAKELAQQKLLIADKNVEHLLQGAMAMVAAEGGDTEEKRWKKVGRLSDSHVYRLFSGEDNMVASALMFLGDLGEGGVLKRMQLGERLAEVLGNLGERDAEDMKQALLFGKTGKPDRVSERKVSHPVAELGQLIAPGKRPFEENLTDMWGSKEGKVGAVRQSEERV